MTREEAARVLTKLADEYEKYEISADGWLRTTYIPAHRMAAAALLGPQPDPITGLVPCEYCGAKRDKSSLIKCGKCKPYSTENGNITVEALVNDGALEIFVGMIGGVFAAGALINFCPMCGRKLTAPPRPGTNVPDAGEMDPNGDEGATHE